MDFLRVQMGEDASCPHGSAMDSRTAQTEAMRPKRSVETTVRM